MKASAFLRRPSDFLQTLVVDGLKPGRECWMSAAFLKMPVSFLKTPTAFLQMSEVDGLKRAWELKMRAAFLRMSGVQGKKLCFDGLKWVDFLKCGQKI